MPDLRLLKDSINNKIVLECIKEIKYSALKKNNIPDLPERLILLVKGNLLKSDNDTYKIAFPIIINEGRKKLNKFVRQECRKIYPSIIPIVQELSDSLREKNSAIKDHILWSRIIDVSWGQIWIKIFSDQNPPNVRWIVWPHHSHSVGTNYCFLPGDGNLAMTWSRDYTKHLSTLAKYKFELTQIAWNQKVKNIQTIKILNDFGVVNLENQLTCFSFFSNDKYARLFSKLTSKYVNVVSDNVKLSDLAKEFKIDEQSFSIIFLHELAYELFKQMEFKTPKKNVKNYVSLRLGNQPQIEDKALELYDQNRWKGNNEIIAEFEKVLNIDTDNFRIMYYLGLSYFDIGNYDASISILKKLHKKVEFNKKEKYRRDWSLIWIGHNYDLLGKRKEAKKYYRKVLNYSDKSGEYQMNQYNIKSITAQKWVEERFNSPFKLK
ncbi:MAG: tetratricopeptide repeat protein [Rhodothermaceae bacterium]